MKKSAYLNWILFFSLSFLLSFSVKAQTQLWGMTYNGGQFDAGTIFKTDGSGNNQIVQYDNFKQEGAKPQSTILIEASDGKLYGMTREGGTYGLGIIFQYDPTTNIQTKKIDFAGATNGSYPYGSLQLANDGKFYGMTSNGGGFNMGVIFQYDPVTNTCTKKLDFAGVSNGGYPYDSFVLTSDEKLYGMTTSGGINNVGVIFQYDPSTNIYTKKFDFATGTNGYNPVGTLMQASDGKLYGMTDRGGTSDKGVIFQYDPSTNIYTKKFDFDGITNGQYPNGSLMQANDGKLYGLTTNGGIYYMGVLFQYDPATNVYTKKMDFTVTANGYYPNGTFMQASNGKLYGLAAKGGTNNMGALFQYDPANNTYTKKIDFDGTNGSTPYGSLMQASNGKLYGMTNAGGTNSKGVLFQYDPDANTYIKKFDFFGLANGTNPNGSMIQASDGKLYGVTSSGGANSMGILFQYDPATKTYIKKVDFDGASYGSYPTGSLLQASDGKLYGMTSQGGVNNMGVLFQYDPIINTYTKKLDFAIGANGRIPYGSLIQASDGKLYGMTYSGGSTIMGVIFQYNPVTNIYTKKIDFTGTNGQLPYGSLLQASDGKLYGMTSSGGTNNKGVLFQYDPVTNVYTKKLDFSGTANGQSPYGSLVQANDGKLYGMTYIGGVNGMGVLFQYDLITNTCSKKLDFNGSTNGQLPNASLLQASDGKLYGTTYWGGTNNNGVLFQYDPTANTYTKKLDFNGVNGKNPQYTNLIEIAVSLSTASVNSSNCSGHGISVPYTISGAYDAGNAFTAQLSDASGSFASPVNIGTIMSTVAGTINAFIPSNTPFGTAYRIRVVSASPVIIGSDNGSNIVINARTTSTINASSCDSYTAPDSVVYTTSGTKTAIIPNSIGCDSSITINLTINSNTSVTTVAETITVNETGATYQWIDCNTNSNVPSNGTSQSYTAISNGRYKVVVTKNNCSDTSSCTSITSLGVSQISNLTPQFSISPNPSSETITINSTIVLPATLIFADMLGREVLVQVIKTNNQTVDISQLNNGVYIYKVTNTKNENSMGKWVKN